MTQILLIDNGSSRPDSTLNLRRIAKALSDQSGKLIHPVSLQHANKAPIEALDGIPAHVLETFLEQQLAQGETRFLLLPLFYGKSRALTSFVPDVYQRLQATHSDFEVEIADVLYPLPQGESKLVQLLLNNIQQTAEKHQIQADHIILVDHGSPIPQVAQVRIDLATQLQTELPRQTLSDACMERRKSKQYDFNGILLEDELVTIAEKANDETVNVIVSLLFTSPGTHAGEGGDIAMICEAASQQHPHLNIYLTPLVGESPILIDILIDRIKSNSDFNAHT